MPTNFRFQVKSTIFLMLFFYEKIVSAHSFDQKINLYRDNHGVERRATQLGLGIDIKHYGNSLTQSNYNLNWSNDWQEDHNYFEERDKGKREFYGTPVNNSQNINAQTSQTFHRITTTRQLVDFSLDEKIKARTGSLGASHWFRHETLELSLDYSRTVLNRPTQDFLDYDFETIILPSHVNSYGWTLGVKNLTTPTTVLSSNYSFIQSSDHPASHYLGGGIKQFIPASQSAIHANVIYARSEGKLPLTTALGNVASWSSEIAWLQTISRTGTLTRLAYRIYREDQTTRAYQDQLVYGSDLVSLGILQNLPKMNETLNDVQVHIKASRYLNNQKLAANVLEGGVVAKF